MRKVLPSINVDKYFNSELQSAFNRVLGLRAIFIQPKSNSGRARPHITWILHKYLSSLPVDVCDPPDVWCCHTKDTLISFKLKKVNWRVKHNFSLNFLTERRPFLFHSFERTESKSTKNTFCLFLLCLVATENVVNMEPKLARHPGNSRTEIWRRNGKECSLLMRQPFLSLQRKLSKDLMESNLCIRRIWNRYWVFELH